jgi:hypothetical protein
MELGTLVTGVIVGGTVIGASEGTTLGASLARELGVWLGDVDGVPVTIEGCALGDGEGISLRGLDGRSEGLVDGTLDGDLDGARDGNPEGLIEGL